MVLGSSEEPGKLVVTQLLEQNVEVIAILCSSSHIPVEISSQNKIQIIKAEISELQENELVRYLQDCDGVIAWLGHNLTLKGMFWNPRLLVTDSVRKYVEQSKVFKRSYQFERCFCQ